MNKITTNYDIEKDLFILRENGILIIITKKELEELIKLYNRCFDLKKLLK